VIDKNRLLHIGWKLVSYLRKEEWQIEPNGMAKSISLQKSEGWMRPSANVESEKGGHFAAFYDPTPFDSIANPCRAYSLINSVAFHPHELMFCATFTTAHKVAIFRIDPAGKIRTVQVLKNPRARLRGPQHAVFSGDGNKIIVSNWNNATLTIYRRTENGLYSRDPVACIDFPEVLAAYKPHGMDMSPSGKFMAIAFGAAARQKKGVALFSFNSEETILEHLSLIDEEELPGIPKGITFSPDESCLLVTFSDVNSIQIYNLDLEMGSIQSTPRQIVKGEITGLFRPEDIKMSREGDFLIVSNSEADRVTVYPFDKVANRITQAAPCRILENPVSHLRFPHGIAVSPDGSILAITQFGPLQTTRDEDIVFDIRTPRKQSSITIYRRERPGSHVNS